MPYKWVKADQLSLGDVLFKKDHTFVRIKSICRKKGPVVMRFIRVEKNENFLISENGVLVHNGLFGATFGTYAGKFLVHFVAHSAILVAGAMTGPAAPATISALEATFLPTIEAASNVGAIVGGILCATATGPV